MWVTFHPRSYGGAVAAVGLNAVRVLMKCCRL
jgi:hypothetical protein